MVDASGLGLLLRRDVLLLAELGQAVAHQGRVCCRRVHIKGPERLARVHRRVPSPVGSPKAAVASPRLAGDRTSRSLFISRLVFRRHLSASISSARNSVGSSEASLSMLNA